MKEIGILLALFVLGAVYDAVCTLWVHYVERLSFVAVPMSCALGTMSLVGFGESLTSRWRACAYVLGFGFGTGCAIVWKRYTRRSRVAQPGSATGP